MIAIYANKIYIYNIRYIIPWLCICNYKNTLLLYDSYLIDLEINYIVKLLNVRGRRMTV